jgi:flagellar basal body-associated protein FliL
MKTFKKMKKIIIIAVSVIVLAAVGVGLAFYFSYNNKEIALRAQIEAQRGKVEGVRDKMWKVIQQKANVSDEYKDAFEKVYPEIMAERYSGNGDGSLMKWVTEQNPTFDTSLYKDLSQSIEIMRTEFQKNQERMLDLIREHTTLITTYPGRWFISNKTPIEYTVVSSTKTKVVMETGLDDDVELFK